MLRITIPWTWTLASQLHLYWSEEQINRAFSWNEWVEKRKGTTHFRLISRSKDGSITRETTRLEWAGLCHSIRTLQIILNIMYTVHNYTLNPIFRHTSYPDFPKYILDAIAPSRLPRPPMFSVGQLRTDGLYQSILASWQRSSRAWFYVPLGICCILLACWGLDRLIRLTSVSFPASVALLVILFFGLIACQAVLGDRQTKAIIRIVDIPVSNVCFSSCPWLSKLPGRLCSTIHQCILHASIW